MSTNVPPPPVGRNHFPGCLAAALLLVLVPAGVGLGFLGWMATTDASSTEDHWWGAIALAGAACKVVGSLLAVLFIWQRKPAYRHVATVCLGLGVIANGLAAVVGLNVVFAAQARGGDWGALAVATAKVFCVAVPVSSAILAAIALASLGRVRYEQPA